jgi:Tfp pilus assembly protein PilX
MESMVANQVAMMAAIAALGDAEHVCRSFAFQSHSKVVRAANSCVRDLFQSSIVPMPLAPVEPLLP